MSGQQVDVALATETTVAFGDLDRTDDRVGIFDTSGFPPGFAAIGGVLSLAYFDETPVPLDYAQRIVQGETAETLAARAAAGRSGGVRVGDDGPPGPRPLPPANL